MKAKEYFLDEHNKKQKVFAEERRARIKLESNIIRAAFVRRFGVHPRNVVYNFVYVDDITFLVTLRADGEIHYVQIKGICPKQGEIAFSRKCYHDWEIGGMIKTFRTEDDHVCRLR